MYTKKNTQQPCFEILRIKKRKGYPSATYTMNFFKQFEL